ncbi:MAG: hypothetical protein WCB68_13990 [Pyrinomonadaceae bacterium]
MSASTQLVATETHRVGGRVDVRAALRELYARRVLWRACAELAMTLACALVLLCAIGVADYAWPLARAVRVALVLPVALLFILSFVSTILRFARRRTLASISRIIERAASLEENALVTFAESLEGARGFAPELYMIARLETQARNQLLKIDGRVVAPARNAGRGAVALAFVIITLLALRLATPAAFSLEARRVLRLERDDANSQRAGLTNNLEGGKAAGDSVFIEEFRVRVIPPAYSGLSVEEMEGDASVRALAGSRVEVALRVRGNVQSAMLGYGGANNPMRSLGEGRYVADFIASASGTLEAQVLKDGSANAALNIIRAVEVFADAAPEVRIIEPAGDQLLRNQPAAPISVRWIARDDLGLARATLKYIKSRGEGDAAKFTNGELAPTVSGNIGAREWNGAATLDLARLGVAAGDTLVFWIETRDRNPSANNLGRSQSLAIAIAAPDAPRLTLGDLRPNDIGRFLLSERLIIIHTEKLHSERVHLAPDAIKQRAAEIAAEQREFKNSFKDFLEIEGASGAAEESAEAKSEQSVEERVRAAESERTEVHLHGIPEPPAGSPATIKEMVYAIRSMWDAEDALSLSDTAGALKSEREALLHLKRAQTAVRYIPHVVAQSKAVDLKRRYAGELAEIRTQLERLTHRSGSKDSPKIRASLADSYGALADLQSTLDAPSQSRAGAIERARLRVRAAADRLVTLGGDHAATIAEAAAQLRLVETELARVDASGRADEYANRLSKSLSLLTQAAANLFALADVRTLSNNGDASTLLPANDARAAEYFRRLHSAPR